MRFWGYRIRRDGVPLAKWQRAGARCEPGELHLAERLDASVGRTVRFASFHLVADDGAYFAQWPDLLDAQLLAVRSDCIVLAGLELEPLSGRHLAQSWCLYCRPQDDA